MDAIICKNVTLQLPVRTSRRRSAARSVASAFTGGILQGNQRVTTIKALSDVTVTIKSGEKVALIGHNGAGKSTFLRLSSGIFVPTSGQIIMPQPATPLIDKSFIVDTDLTGFEVCRAHYLKNNGSKNLPYASFLDDVLSFTELGEFLSAAVSSYSDGMRTRLMFALITAFPHAVLAMDEGIAAGDRFFIDKASNRFDDFLTRSSTLLIASHDESLLQRFTTRGIVFEKGAIVFDGPLSDALSYYRRSH